MTLSNSSADGVLRGSEAYECGTECPNLHIINTLFYSHPMWKEHSVEITRLTHHMLGKSHVFLQDLLKHYDNRKPFIVINWYCRSF